jgi:hypothetical protein
MKSKKMRLQENATVLKVVKVEKVRRERIKASES